MTALDKDRVNAAGLGLLDLLHDIGLSGALIAAGFVLLMLVVAEMTPGPLNPGWWLVVAVQLLTSGLVAKERGQ